MCPFYIDLNAEILYNYKKIYVGGNLHFLRVFLSAIFTVGIMTPGFCGVGDVDNRYYVTDEMWSQSPYNVFVHLSAGGHACTAQYVAKNLIVSAGHCTEDRPNKYEAYNYKKQTFPVKLLYTPWVHPRDDNMDTPGDYAIFLVEDSRYYSDAFFDVVAPEHTKIDVINAGFGSVRILKNEEIQAIREIIGSKLGARVDFAHSWTWLRSE